MQKEIYLSEHELAEKWGISYGSVTNLRFFNFICKNVLIITNNHRFI